MRKRKVPSIATCTIRVHYLLLQKGIAFLIQLSGGFGCHPSSKYLHHIKFYTPQWIDQHALDLWWVCNVKWFVNYSQKEGSPQSMRAPYLDFTFWSYRYGTVLSLENLNISNVCNDSQWTDCIFSPLYVTPFCVCKISLFIFLKPILPATLCSVVQLLTG